jgi:hypothetical protein
MARAVFAPAESLAGNCKGDDSDSVLSHQNNSQTVVLTAPALSCDRQGELADDEPADLRRGNVPVAAPAEAKRLVRCVVTLTSLAFCASSLICPVLCVVFGWQAAERDRAMALQLPLARRKRDFNRED